LAGARVFMKFRAQASQQEDVSERGNLRIILAASWAIPLLVFLFALAVTHTYDVRYAIAAAFGLSIALVVLIASFPAREAICCLLLLIAAPLAFTPAVSPGPTPASASVFSHLPANLPIATGNALRFFELRASNAPFAGRLVYLSSPPPAQGMDLTNEHQLLRWKQINPALPVEDATSFIRQHPQFLVFSDCAAVDALPDFLAQRGYKLVQLSKAGCASMSEVAAQGRVADKDQP
jgi:hypothetical protein